jgi:hypothetical protein
MEYLVIATIMENAMKGLKEEFPDCKLISISKGSEVSLIVEEDISTYKQLFRKLKL